ncbi:p21-C-terminal region-binding protein-domain-containing protein [Durotheca rogersii]|uniref:p21-C-terminal region-binding protein-domain-containing protein n=1 Tax=Durotheca rogersii TaxID=419775 RepID=UPI00221FFC2A|nr:p21-C-terminal region-binding protein-domain-containing protein [Durotheca rogersii]KAI5868392.1 p21-C-terminal region-binding protein-domain-containing protein [Durotheca rogersii]
MAKKRAREADGTAVEAPDKIVEDANSSDEEDEDFDTVNVDFEWFNFDAAVDFHGTKSLLRQLFDVDAARLDLSGLADLILGQPTIGSTVKVDGKAADAYAFVTALNLREHRAREPVAALARYLAERARANDALAPALADLLAPPAAAAAEPTVALVLSERLINMPAEIAPPMYRMLIDEIEAAVEDGEPYAFTHYLIVSKTYHEIESTLDVVAERKRKKGRQDPALFYFHPEDEVLQRYAVAHGSFPYANTDEAVADSKRAFQEMGIISRGSMMLIEASKFAEAVKAISDEFSPPS